MPTSEARPRALVTPAVLVWAREAAGLDPGIAATKLQVKPERLVSWETGEQRPTFPQLLKLANVYKRNPAVFYMPAPPVEQVPVHDFRRLPNTLDTALSPELRHEIRLAASRREIMLDILGPDTPKSRLPNVRLKTAEPEETAAAIRKHLGISLTEQKAWREPRIGFQRWRESLEGIGVLVFQTTRVDVREMRGFSLVETSLPVILLNGGDAHAGRGFSAIHELCHLILRDGGLCLPGDERHAVESDHEILCNRIAGAVLVPAAALISEPLVQRTVGREAWTDDNLAALAREFGTSRETVLRRLLILGRTTERFYRQKREQFHKEWEAQQERAGGFVVKVHTKTLNRLGRLYSRSVLEGFYDGRLSGSDLPRYLGLRLKHLSEFEAAVYRA